MTPLTHAGQRTIGLVLAAAILFVIDPAHPGVTHKLALPLTLAVAAWLMTRSLMAVLMAAGALFALNADWGGDNAITSTIYPVLAFASLVGCLVIVGLRWRDKARATHEERWSRRRRT